jgi:hypothetical protein
VTCFWQRGDHKQVNFSDLILYGNKRSRMAAAGEIVYRGRPGRNAASHMAELEAGPCYDSRSDCGRFSFRGILRGC